MEKLIDLECGPDISHLSSSIENMQVNVTIEIHAQTTSVTVSFSNVRLVLPGALPPPPHISRRSELTVLV